MKNYLIIGASSGIGKQLTELLAFSGNKIYGTFHKQAVEENNPLIEFHALNVLDNEIKFDYLPEILDGLVYCPGSISLKPFQRIKPEDFLSDYQLQLVGAVKCIQAVLPILKKSESSSIVLFSSVAVQQGFNYHSVIAASKGAIEGLTRSLAAEFAPKIRVNCIAPSLTDTPLASQLLNTDEKRTANALRHPMKRIGQASDIANMAEFLLSEKSTWITGQIFNVDGGISSLKI
jgi:NAD(P)-dependent dehydrogenase (short-subunit alcohol dehydrogenase family)